jgi:3'-5' exoribonuclease
MPTVRLHEPMSTWEEGDFVQSFALVNRKERRQDRKGRDYLDLELADATGSVVGKVWPDSPALDATFEDKQFVLFKGLVRRFKDHLQVNVDFCRPVNDGDRRDGFREADFVPTTPQDIDELWRRLGALYPGVLTREPLRRLAEETLARHGEALREHPAAKTIHHAYRGGLLEHVVSMAELAARVCDHYAEVDRDLLLVGVLFHDLGKLRELGPMPVNDYTLEGQLVGHVVIGHGMLLECCAAVPGFPADLRLRLEHLVLSHHGQRQYGSPTEPSTPEAFVLSSIDELDSRLCQLRDVRRQGGGLQYVRGLGRSVYLDGPVEA